MEVAEDRLWRSSSSKFNTRGPVSERAAHGLEAWWGWGGGGVWFGGEGRRVGWVGGGRGSQSLGIRREAASEGRGRAAQSVVLRSRQALSGHTITQVGRASNR